MSQNAYTGNRRPRQEVAFRGSATERLPGCRGSGLGGAWFGVAESATDPADAGTDQHRAEQNADDYCGADILDLAWTDRGGHRPPGRRFDKRHSGARQSGGSEVTPRATHKAAHDTRPKFPR